MHFLVGPSTALLHHCGHKFHEVFPLKQGRYSELPATEISELMKSNSFDESIFDSFMLKYQIVYLPLTCCLGLSKLMCFIKSTPLVYRMPLHNHGLM